MRPSEPRATARAAGSGRLPDLGASGDPCWPELDLEGGSILMVRAMPPGVDPAAHGIICRAYVGVENAQMVFDYMRARPDQWPLWGRLACLFGERALRAVVLGAAEREAETDAVRAEEARLELAERRRLHTQVDLYILDQKNKRPGLSLESGDASKPFFVMRFSEKWERERVLDWLRWQKHRFLEFRDLFEAEGAVILERLIIAGMRETEAQVKARGDASGGRRPLRFWRGE